MAILRVQDSNGNVTVIPAIKGETPIKGVDYFTKQEQIKFCEAVLAALPTYEMVVTLDDGTTETYSIYGEQVTE